MSAFVSKNISIINHYEKTVFFSATLGIAQHTVEYEGDYRW